MDKKMDVLKWIFRFLVLVVAVLFIAGEFFLPGQNKDEMYCEQFDVPWKLIREDGSVISDVRIPGSYDVARNEKITVETVIPEDIEENLYLCFQSVRQEMDIYVDGQLRTEYSTLNSKPYGSSSAGAYVFMRIEEGDGGKLLRVIYQTDTEYSGKLRVIYYGDKMGIWRELFKISGGELIVSLVLLLLSVVSIVGSLILRFCYNKSVELEYLGWGVLLAACWMISDSVFRQLIFPNISLANDLAFIMVMLMAFPFMIYLNELQKRRYNTYYVVMCILVAVDMVVCVTLQLLNVVDFADSISVSAIFCGAGIILMIATVVSDCVKGYIVQYKLVAVGILGAILAAVVQLILYFSRSATYTGLMIAYGMIFLLVISIINTVRDTLHIENEKQQAIYANQSKARFLANMSHEIRTPINAVLGMDEMILKESTEPAIKEYALDIQNAGKNLLALINDILDFSKIESGKMEIVPCEYELSSLLCDCYNMVAIKAQEKKLKFTVENNRTLPKRLYGDEVRLRQVIVNLLTNAVKYTKEGSITMSVQGQRMENEMLLLQISVQDTGIGIAEENRKQLFESFKRVDEKRNRSIEGTGLGLAITKQIVDLMHGTISVESEYEKGSVFRVEIPQKIADNHFMGEFSTKIEDETQKEESSSEKLIAPNGQILVVDDVEMNLKVFVGLLKNTKLQIDTALSGKEALDKASRKKYHIIFLDHMMPDMDGIETFRELKQMKSSPNADTPVIMLTANAIVGVREEYLQEGFADYLSKPVQSSSLELMIKQYLPSDIIETKEPDKIQNNSENSREKNNEKNSEKNNENSDADISVKKVEKEATNRMSLTDRIDFLDTKAGMRFSDNSEEFYIELLQTYAGSDKTQLLEQYYAQQDWENYCIHVHALKSNSLYIGANELGEHAKALEMASKNGDTEYIHLHHKELLEEYAELLGRLKEIL